eukprot:scaffold32716_cov34-Cyclotella_meneghiniana.AAC.1
MASATSSCSDHLHHGDLNHANNCGGVQGMMTPNRSETPDTRMTAVLGARPRRFFSCGCPTPNEPKLAHPAKQLLTTFVVALVSISLRSRFFVVGGSDLLGREKSGGSVSYICYLSFLTAVMEKERNNQPEMRKETNKYAND